MKKFIKNHFLILTCIFLYVVLIINALWHADYEKFMQVLPVFIWLNVALLLEYSYYKKRDQVIDLHHENDAIIERWYQEMEKRVTAESENLSLKSQLTRAKTEIISLEAQLGILKTEIEKRKS